jgi:hypothetical protein
LAKILTVSGNIITVQILLIGLVRRWLELLLKKARKTVTLTRYVLIMNIQIYMNSHAYVISCTLRSTTISLLHSRLHKARENHLPRKTRPRKTVVKKMMITTLLTLTR